MELIMKKCHFCAEESPEGAKKCPCCGEWLDIEPKMRSQEIVTPGAEKREDQKPSPFTFYIRLQAKNGFGRVLSREEEIPADDEQEAIKKALSANLGWSLAQSCPTYL